MTYTLLIKILNRFFNYYVKQFSFLKRNWAFNFQILSNSENFETYL